MLKIAIAGAGVLVWVSIINKIIHFHIFLHCSIKTIYFSLVFII